MATQDIQSAEALLALVTSERRWRNVGLSAVSFASSQVAIERFFGTEHFLAGRTLDALFLGRRLFRMGVRCDAPDGFDTH
jgi:hypothetical protein